MKIKKGSVILYGKKLGIVKKIKGDGTFDIRLYEDLLNKHSEINTTEDKITKIIKE